MKVVWVRNDEVLPDSQDFRYQDDGSGSHSLVIRDVFPEDAAVYICEAYNKHGEAHCYCRLSVHGKSQWQPVWCRLRAELLNVSLEIRKY